MQKKELRNIFFKKRKLISKVENDNLSISTFDLFTEVFSPKNEKIHVFLPILSKNEVNTNSLIQHLFHETNCTVIASKSNFTTLEMKHFIIDEDTSIENDKYGIPTPVNAIPISEKEIDWIIVPLLCFDERGYRVGYGKGFYDRFISKCRPDVNTIGLSIHEPIKEISDINEYDIALDHCVTPKKVYHFK